MKKLYIRSAHEKKRIRGKIFGERKYLVSRGKEKKENVANIVRRRTVG